MCLSIPSLVVEIHPEDLTATIDTLGVRRRASTHLLNEPLAVGDYVLIHIGFIMNKIDIEDAKISLDMYKEIIEKMDKEA